jgi:hypothetical protein
LCNWMASLQCDSLYESSPDVEKLLSHLVHFNGCILHGSSGGTSIVNSLDNEKLLPHFMHLNCFSPVSFLSWIVMWKTSWDFNGFLHGSSDGTQSVLILLIFVQLNGFSPVWFPLWIFTWCGKAPVTFGALQWLFPSRILWWYFKSLDHEKLLPHFMHLNGFSPLWFLSWIMMWKSSWDFNGFFPSWILGWHFKYFYPM